MENIWLNLIEDERALLRLEGPRCWPTDPSSLPPDLADAPPASVPTQWAYEGSARLPKPFCQRKRPDGEPPRCRCRAAQFRSIVHSTGESRFGIAPEGPHRDAVVLDVLRRNARILSAAELDSQGELYSPSVSAWQPHAASWRPLGCRALASGGAQYGSHASSDSERPRGIRNGRVEIGSPAVLFKQELAEAINQAALANGVSYLNKEDRQVALGLASNWGMRLLLKVLSVRSGHRVAAFQSIGGRRQAESRLRAELPALQLQTSTTMQSPQAVDFSNKTARAKYFRKFLAKH